MKPASPENVVRTHYDAIKRRDINAVLGTLADDVDWKFDGPTSIPFAGQYIGREAVSKFFSIIRQTVEVQKFCVEQIIVDNETVIVLGNEHFVVTATGKEWATEWVQVFKAENGLIARFREYSDTAQISSAYEP